MTRSRTAHTLLGLAVTTLAMAAPAAAQDDAVARCRAEASTDAERIACLENALRGESAPATEAASTSGADAAAAAEAAAARAAAAAEAAAQAAAAATAAAEAAAAAQAATPAATPAAAMTAPAAPAAPPAAPAAEERRGLLRMPRLPFTGRNREETAAAAEATTAATSSATASSAVDPDSFGAETLRTPGASASNARPRLHASVVEVSEAPYRRLQVELDNGQVWRATQSEENWNFALNPDPTEVEIFRSRFGGYRMKLMDRPSTLRVERVR